MSLPGSKWIKSTCSECLQIVPFQALGTTLIIQNSIVEAAWRAVECSAHWKAEFERLTRRMHPTKAIVAIARKMLVAIWHVLHEQAADVHADAELVAFKFRVWSWKLTDEQRGGLTTRQACPERSRRVVRYQLMHLGLGHDLTHVVRGGAKRLIAPAEEVLQLKPELRAA